MTPEELDEARKVAGGLFAVTDSIVEFYERKAIKTYSKLILYIDELERENTDQAAEIKRLEVAAGDLRELAYKQRLAVRKLGEKVRSKHRAWRKEQKWHDIDLGRVKRLEDALDKKRNREADLLILVGKQYAALKKLGRQYHILRDMLRDPDIDYRMAQNPEYVSERLKGGME